MESQAAIPPVPPQQHSQEMKPVICICGAHLLIPIDVFVFQCGGCKQIMSTPKPLTEADRKRQAHRALNRWLVREAVSKELDDWLNGHETFSKDSNSIVARLYRVICDFPLFNDKSTGIDKALLDFFLFLPQIEEKMVKMGDSRDTVRVRFVNYIAGPLFYASFGEDDDSKTSNLILSSRGEKRDFFKHELASLLREIEKPDGAATILEAIESAHSVQEIPGAFARMLDSHRESAVANLEHSLAKPRGRSKLKSLYHLTPRRTIIKLMKMKVGGGMASAAINLFLAKPFGSRSLMQRMASTTLGVSDAEDLALYCSKRLSPTMHARCLAFIANQEGDERHDIIQANDEDILKFLGSEELTKTWNCPPVPESEIKALRAECERFYADASIRASKNLPLANQKAVVKDDDDSDSDEDSSDEASFDVSDSGEVKVLEQSKNKFMQRRSSKFEKLKRRKDSEVEVIKPHPLHFVRVFCEQEFERQMGETLVDLLGDEPLEKLIRVSLPIIQHHMITTMSARGSGLIPLLEGLFDAWKTILHVHKEKQKSAEEKRQIFRNVVEQIHQLTFTLVHNLVRGDKTGKWHELIYWLVDLWNNFKIDVDTNSMISSLSEADQKLIESEAELLREHHEQNSKRELGSKRIPTPALDASWKLVATLRERISQGLFHAGRPLKTEIPPIIPVAQPELSVPIADLSIKETGFSTDRPRPRSISSNRTNDQNVNQIDTKKTRPKVKRLLSSFDVQHAEHQERLFLSHLEVVYSYEDESSMSRRGYERIPVDFSMDGDTKSWLWIRRSLPEHMTSHDGSNLEWMQPITDVRIVDTETVDAVKNEVTLKSRGYVMIAKPLDKRNYYLWYQRDPKSTPLKNITAVRLDDENAQLRQEALKAAGYALIAPTMKYTVKSLQSFFGMGGKVCTIGLYVKK